MYNENRNQYEKEIPQLENTVKDVITVTSLNAQYDACAVAAGMLVARAY